ncbi:MAG: DUF721 domain-containing protein [Candidatus Edwardsbacteria bacterium]
MQKPEAVGSILKRVISDLGIEKKLKEEEAILQWPEVVGPLIAGKTLPFRVERGKLFVKVSSSVWMQQLIFLRPQIVEKLNTKIGKKAIEEIIFLVGE